MLGAGGLGSAFGLHMRDVLFSHSVLVRFDFSDWLFGGGSHGHRQRASAAERQSQLERPHLFMKRPSETPRTKLRPSGGAGRPLDSGETRAIMVGAVILAVFFTS